MVTGGGRTTSLVQTLANGDTVLKYAYTDPGEALVAEPVRQELYGYGDPEWKDLLTTYNGETLTYDGIGNPLTYTKGRVLTWQNGRRLASITEGNQTSVYTYNAEGIRTSKTVGEETTRYIVNGSRILCEVRPDGTKVYFYYDEGGSLLSMEYGDTMYYYVKNLQGDIVQLIDETGNVAAGYQYDTWGKVTGLTGEDGEEVGLEEAHIGNINPFRYRGYYYDVETGLYYLGSRYYDPEVGRFLNSDSLIDNRGVITQNLFTYCGNNPVNNADSTGHLFGAVIGGIVGGILGGLTAAASGKSVIAGIATGALTGAIVGGICDGTTLTVGAVIGAMAKCAVVGAVGNLLNQSLNYAVDKYNQSKISNTKKELTSKNIENLIQRKYLSYSEYIDVDEIAKAAIITAAFVPLSVVGGAVVNVAYANMAKSSMNSISRFVAEWAIGENVSMLQTSTEYVIQIFEP